MVSTRALRRAPFFHRRRPPDKRPNLFLESYAVRIGDDGLLTVGGRAALVNPKRAAGDFGCWNRQLTADIVTPAPAPSQSADATTAPTHSWTTSSGRIGKPEVTGLQTTAPDRNGLAAAYAIRWIPLEIPSVCR